MVFVPISLTFGRLAAALAVAGCFALALSGAAHALDGRSHATPDAPVDRHAFPSWLTGAIHCGNGFEQSARSGWRCLSGRLGGLVMEQTANFVNEQGRALFGPNFRFVSGLSWSPYGEGLNGNVDTVLPVASFTAKPGSGPSVVNGGAFFFQQGATRWTDDRGRRRNDLRYGAAYRFSLLGEPGANVFGLSTLVQENVERGHRRVVAGIDYAGRWGRASLQQFVPATDWRPSRFGYVERPRGGTRLGARLNLTTTVSLDASVAEWETSRPGRRETDGRVGLGWRPHPWLRLRAGFAGIGSAEDSGSVTAALRIPFGGVPQRKAPRWEWLGVAGGSRATADVWRPVENVERLETIEREAAATERTAAGSVGVRFLQSGAASGAEIGVEAYIPAPLASDLRLLVRLVPGDGANPAVPGVDYVDEPTEVTIRAGATTARAAIRLLSNPAMREARSLSAEVSPAA